MRSVRKILSDRETPALLGKRLSGYEALCRQVRECLPSPLDQQLKATVLQAGTLSLFAESPVWASRLRYAAPQLQRQLAGRGLTVQRIRTRILPGDTAKPLKPERKRHLSLSRESGEILRQTAAAINDAPLREALLKLSRHEDKG